MSTRTGQGQLTKNFHISEFKCKDGTHVPVELLPKALALAKELQVIRDHLGEAIHINSAYRTPSYNKKIGGAPNSYHPKMMAADCTVKSLSPVQFRKVVEQLIKEGKLKIGGVGRYKGFTHLDIGPNRRWNG